MILDANKICLAAAAWLAAPSNYLASPGSSQSPNGLSRNRYDIDRIPDENRVRPSVESVLNDQLRDQFR